MEAELRSLRLRLAVAGFVAAYGLVLVLLAVVLASEEIDVRQAGSDVDLIEPDPIDEGSGGRGVVPLTAALLAPVAAGLAWWWSGRAVRPVARAMTLQRHLIEETSHELRTPLSILTTNADVLLANPDPTIEHYRRGLERSPEPFARLPRPIAPAPHDRALQIGRAAGRGRGAVAV